MMFTSRLNHYFSTLIETLLMDNDNPGDYIQLMADSEDLANYVPELIDLIGCEQNPEFHPEGDVFTHTMMVVNQASEIKHLIPEQNRYAFMLSALFHDIGKPASAKFDEDQQKVTTYEHDDIGADMIRGILTRNITTDEETIKYVQLMTRHHMQPRWLFPQAKIKPFRKLAKSMHGYIDDLFILVEADTQGRGNVNTDDFNKYKNFFTKRIAQLRNQDSNKTDIQPLVTGNDLIRQGVKPGRDLGVMLAQAAKCQAQGMTKTQIMNEFNLK